MDLETTRIVKKGESFYCQVYTHLGWLYLENTPENCYRSYSSTRYADCMQTVEEARIYLYNYLLKSRYRVSAKARSFFTSTMNQT